MFQRREFFISRPAESEKKIAIAEKFYFHFREINLRAESQLDRNSTRSSDHCNVSSRRHFYLGEKLTLNITAIWLEAACRCNSFPEATFLFPEWLILNVATVWPELTRRIFAILSQDDIFISKKRVAWRKKSCGHGSFNFDQDWNV